MIKDPLLPWNGPFPYDVLAKVGITPDSSMKEIMDASFDLMSQGLMDGEVRAAWDQLRIKQKRLLVDIFLYRLDPEAEFTKAMEELRRSLDELTEPPDVSRWLQVGPEVLRQISQEFGQLSMPGVEIRIPPEFEALPPIPEVDINYDV